MPKRNTSKPCLWEARKKRNSSERKVLHGYTWLPFEVMQSVMEFALDNAIIETSPGELMRQRRWSEEGVEIPAF